MLEHRSIGEREELNTADRARPVTGSVDVIVPCYRYGHFLSECISSVLNQSIENLRVLIIDDASPDNTPEVAAELARSDSRVTFLAHPANKGHVATFNEGIEWASANYMMILSADDYLLPGALRRSVEIMDAHPEVGFTFGKVIVLYDRHSLAEMGSLADKNDYRILSGLDFIRRSGAHNIVPAPAAVVRTALHKRVGGYCPELPHAGDLNVWFRLAAYSSVGILEANQAVYRRHSNNMSLTYQSKSWLPDLQQRQVALDLFLQSCSGVLPDISGLRSMLFRSLAAQAVGFASAAFNAGAYEASVTLSDFALGLSPDVKRSSGWLKLACKRRLGPKLWHVLRSAFTSTR